MESIISFYYNVIGRKRFYFPLGFFSIIAYSFSMYNRTISWDDLLRDHYFGSGNIFLSGRWGSAFLIRLLGMTGLDPFVDKFLAMMFLIGTAILLCYLLYNTINAIKNVLCFALFASAFVTYPLINEIWEYSGANFILTVGLFLTTLAAIILRSNLSKIKKIFFSSALLLIPVSSYESSVFFYISLICMLFFYEGITHKKLYGFKDWLIRMFMFMAPLCFAVIMRFVISILINVFLNLNYASGGATNVNWIGNQFSIVIRNMFVSNILYYIVSGLVYFPIFIFCLFLLFFLVVLFSKIRKLSIVLLGILLIISLFFQAILQGGNLPYRNAQTISLFVAFVLFLICVYSLQKSKLIRYVTLLLSFVFCWYQAVYLNRVLCLNNLRSDNELSLIRQIGKDLVSNYDKKPVVIVSPYDNGPWINSQITVDETSWNGRLFFSVLKNAIGPYKFIDTNINCLTEQYAALKNCFAYCGYNINIVGPVEKPHTPEYHHKDLRLLKDATDIAKTSKMRSYSIMDMGDYIIVSLNNSSTIGINGYSYFYDFFIEHH